MATTPAQIRAEAEAAMRDLGQRRIQVLTELEDLNRALRPHVLHAREVEVPLRRIFEITGITSNTVRDWQKHSA